MSDAEWFLDMARGARDRGGSVARVPGDATRVSAQVEGLIGGTAKGTDIAIVEYLGTVATAARGLADGFGELNAELVRLAETVDVAESAGGAY